MAETAFFFATQIQKVEARFSEKLETVILISKQEALNLGSDSIGVEHLVLGIIREGKSLAFQILKELDTPIEIINDLIMNTVRNRKNHIPKNDNPYLDEDAEMILKVSYLEAKIYKNKFINTVHLLLAILRKDESFTGKVIGGLCLNYEELKNIIENPEWFGFPHYFQFSKY